MRNYNAPLLVLFLTTATWAIALATAWPLEMPIAVTIAGAVAILALFVHERISARLGANRLRSHFADQGETSLASTRPDLVEEVEAMQADFQEAIRDLRASKLGQSGYDALYALPWYMVIGPSGAGKTTAMRASGLDFSFDASEGGLQGIGGTRNCQWWFTNDGVILDTAGRYSTSSADQPEWFAFLDELRGSRSRQPLEGLVIAFPIDLFGNKNEEDLEAIARQLRRQMDEVTRRLDVIVPVYILFTKCDLIPGFVDTFGALRREEAHRIWGFTLPILGQAGQLALSREKLAVLEQRLESVCMARLREARKPEACARILSFPSQFSALRTQISAFFDAVFADDVYTESPIFRGAYFSSGTQSGRPVDRLMTSMSEAFGLPATNLPIDKSNNPRSYFLGDVFRKVVFQDTDIARRTRRESNSRRIARALFLGSVLVATTSLSFASWTAYSDNVRLLAEAHDALEELDARARKSASPSPGPGSSIRGTRAYQSLEYIFEEKAKQESRFGLSVVEPIETVLRRVGLYSAKPDPAPKR
jgi:type VI secretion system protein ImpL